MKYLIDSDKTLSWLWLLYLKEGFWIFDLPKPGSVCMLMYHIVIGKKDRLVNVPTWFLGALRPLYLPIEQKAFSFCVPRDRWDREVFKLQGG